MRVADYESIGSCDYEARYRVFEHRGIEAALSAWVAAPGVASCLEVGAGTGHWLGFLRHRRVVGLDLSASMLAGAREHLGSAPLVRGDAAVLPFHSGSFDRVFCVNAFHHFLDKDGFLVEARRVLRDGGALMNIGLDPHARQDRWWIYEYFPEALAFDRERYVSGQALRDGMMAAGFTWCETVLAERITVTVPADRARADGLFERSFNSQFMILEDAQFQRGLDRLDSDMTRARAGGSELMLACDLHLYATTGWTA